MENQEIKKTTHLFNLAKQFIKFGIVGISNTLISLGIYYIFVFINSDLYLIGYIVGFVVSVINAFIWNTRFVFKTKSDNWVWHLVKTFIVYGSTFLLGLGLLYLLKEKLGVSEFIAPILNLVVTVPLNFFLIKLWALRKNENPKKEESI